ncbi:MAG TPA: glutaredoxin family protein [Opitutaceae bacterium]
MKSNNPVLYTKTGCPWCAEAREVLDRRGIAYTEVNVTTSATAMTEMKRVSGQIKAPVLDWAGDVLADFGASELVPFLDGRAASDRNPVR